MQKVSATSPPCTTTTHTLCCHAPRRPFFFWATVSCHPEHAQKSQNSHTCHQSRLASIERGVNHPHLPPATTPHLPTSSSYHSTSPLKSCLHKIFLDTHFCVRTKRKKKKKVTQQHTQTQGGVGVGGCNCHVGGNLWGRTATAQT